MTAAMTLLKLQLVSERHVVYARQRAREIALLLGFDHQEQIRLATATSELARNAFRYAREGEVTFEVTEGQPQRFLIVVSDKGTGIRNLDEVMGGRYQSRTGLGKGLIGTRRLMDQFDIATGAAGTSVTIGRFLPPSKPQVTPGDVQAIASKLANADVDPFEEIERQNQELLRTLAELREKQELLLQVNHELEDTNRGVVALYAELEQSANDLRRISDLKTSFLSNLSHEFRTPLHSILALCGILTDRADGELSVEQETQVSYIRRSAADLSELVNDLLDMAKVEAGKVEIRPRAFSVADLFGALRGMLRTLLTGTAVNLIFTADEDLPPLFTDEAKVSQILRNLIANALKFTERGHVQVSAEFVKFAPTPESVPTNETSERDAGQMIFRVADTGIGIAAENNERIFEEFIQIENHIQSRVRGTGLGLPLARRLAELLGGTLTVASTLGEGSTFTVTLPVRYAQAAAPLAEAIQHSPDAPLVLIVEDDLNTRFVHQAALKNTAYTLAFARDLEEARAFMQTAVPVALVLDRMLDGVDALSFVEELRRDGYPGRILVVSFMEDDRTPLQAGADAFLPKPVSAGVLKETLAELLRIAVHKPVLLVDDDEINRYLLREALSPFGFRFLEARSGREAMQMSLDIDLSIIFMDLAMPGFTGLETLREIRQNPASANVPVVIHTSKELNMRELQLVTTYGAFVFPKQALSQLDAPEALRAVLTAAGVL